MAEEAPSSSASTAAPPGDLTVNISIVSPSLSANTPLNFLELPASTTIGQLKQKIRDTLDSKPGNDRQRLIHQGKLLARENETLLEVFGEQRLRDSDQMIIHLVIREALDHHPSTSQTTASPRGQSPSPNPNNRIPNPLSPFNPQRAPHHPNHGHHQHLPHFGRPAAAMQGPPFPGQAFGIPPSGNQTPAQLVAQQQQLLNQYFNQLHMAQFNQRAGATPGQQARAGQTHGVQDQTASNGLGRYSPHPETQPYIREGVGHQGELYRVTMNSSFIGPDGQVHSVNINNLQQGHAGPSTPGGPISTNDVHNIIRNADANQATSMMTNAMHRSASGASLANLNLSNQRQPIQAPGVTVPRRPGSTVPLSRTATPDPNTTRTPSYGSMSAPQNQTMRSSTPNHPEVYILNSPTGPRALLINNHSDMYYTPASRVPTLPMMPNFPRPWFQQPLTAPGIPLGQPAVLPQPAAAPAQQQAPQQGNIRVNLYQQGPAVQQQAQPPQVRAQPIAPVALQMHPANPEGGLIGAVLVALWPHIWLLIRLALFVWWFTSSDTSWTRWLTIIFGATAVFIINTGLFNRMANDLFNPLRRHLEGLIPLVGPGHNRDHGRNGDNAPVANAQPGPEGNNNDARPQARQQQDEPDPAQVAARLVAERRENNANWLLNQVRRLERAGLLFLASIAPGVAERHIAHLEAEARAERERREAAERAERERQEEQERAAAETRTEAEDGVAASAESEDDAPTTEREQQQQPVAAA